MKKINLILVLMVIWNYSFGQSSFFPIKKGAVLTYAYGKELYQGHNVDVSQLRMTVKILNETKVINGKDYFILETSSAGSTFRSYLRIGRDGSVLGMREDETKESILMKKSLAVGDSWTTTQMGSKITNKVIDLDGTIKTPNKIYMKCLVIQQSYDDGNVLTGYYQENLGSVAVTLTTGDGEKLFNYLIDEE
jgi:hypothetical protein